MDNFLWSRFLVGRLVRFLVDAQSSSRNVVGWRLFHLRAASKDTYRQNCGVARLRRLGAIPRGNGCLEQPGFHLWLAKTSYVQQDNRAHRSFC